MSLGAAMKNVGHPGSFNALELLAAKPSRLSSAKWCVQLRDLWSRRAEKSLLKSVDQHIRSNLAHTRSNHHTHVRESGHLWLTN